MKVENKPLYALSIEEFIALIKKLIEETLESKEKSKQENVQQEEVFSINELAGFLRCSKVSIHNYKKIGMPFYRVGRKLLFKKTEVLKFMSTLKYKRVITA